MSYLIFANKWLEEEKLQVIIFLKRRYEKERKKQKAN